MLYEELNPEQTADLATYDRFLRGTLSGLAQLAKGADPATWNQFATSQIDPWLGDLPDTETIPTDCGLGQAKPLTAAEFRQLQTLARQLVATLETNRALLVKAIGVNA